MVEKHFYLSSKCGLVVLNYILPVVLKKKESNKNSHFVVHTTNNHWIHPSTGSVLNQQYAMKNKREHEHQL